MKDYNLPLVDWRAGERPSAAKLNKGLEAIRSIQAGPMLPKQTWPDNQIKARMFEIYEEKDDYLVCYNLDGQGERLDPATYTVVAKPWDLRRSVYTIYSIANVTYAYLSVNSRTATYAGSYTETQYILRPYSTPRLLSDGTTRGDLILALSGVSGMPVTVYHGTAAPENETTANWLDTNMGTSPRVWGRYNL